MSANKRDSVEKEQCRNCIETPSTDAENVSRLMKHMFHQMTWRKPQLENAEKLDKRTK